MDSFRAMTSRSKAPLRTSAKKKEPEKPTDPDGSSPPSVAESERSSATARMKARRPLHASGKGVHAAGAADSAILYPAIFTSIRSPMGEGYRIVSAASAISAEERQILTRWSPSHGGLCDDGPDAVGMAGLSLPSGRYAIALSCHAGLEHTGRRGHRVYTQHFIADPDAFARCGSNPFALLRAILEAGHVEPRLKPPETAKTVAVQGLLQHRAQDGDLSDVCRGAPTWGSTALSHLLARERVVVITALCPTEVAEVLWCALPAPLRRELSFSAGVTFSNARPYTLVILPKDSGWRSDLTEGQAITVVETDPRAAALEPRGEGWITFAHSQWSGDRLGSLTQRSEIEVAPLNPLNLDRAGRLFLAQDEMGQAGLARTLAMCEEFGFSPKQAWEAELLVRVQESLASRLGTLARALDAPRIESLWPSLLRLLKRSRVTHDMAWPTVDRALKAWSQRDPFMAARLALSLSHRDPDTGDAIIPASLLEQVLMAWLAACEPLDGAEKLEQAGWVGKWLLAAPTNPVVRELAKRLGVEPQGTSPANPAPNPGDSG